MLALHLLQSALVFVNTILVQSVLKDPAWAERLTDADRRALSARCSGRTPTCTAPSRSIWTPIWIWAWPPDVALGRGQSKQDTPVFERVLLIYALF